MAHKISLKTILAVFALIVSLALIGEIFCRAVMPLKKKRDRYMAVRNVFHLDDRNVNFDDELGYTIKPGITVPFNNEEFRTTVSTNSAGFRGDDGSLKDPPVLILGDSFAFGWGVGQDDTCAERLEKVSGTHVLNMGVSGYGTLQELLALKRYAQKHDVRGKTVVFLVYPNDIADTMGFGSGSIGIKDGALQYSKFNKDTFDEQMRMYKTRSCRGIYQVSYMAYLLKNAQKELKTKFRRKKKAEAPVETAPADRELKFRIFKLVIDEIKKYSEEKGFKTIFVWIPSVRSFEDPSGGEFGDENEADLLKKVQKIFADEALSLYDLKDSLSRADYYILDGHLKPSGQNKAAAEIGKHILK